MNEDYDFTVKRKRPEEIYRNVSDYFTGKILTQYAKSKSIMHIQEKITIRALELIDLKDKNPLFLDAGCGPGFVSIYLKELGYDVVALDIINEFLTYYDIKELNPIQSNMCFPPFRSNSFNAIISISALQWIYRDINDKSMEFNLINLVQSFHDILKPNARAILQFYPKNKTIIEKIGKIIINKTDFEGNFVIDNPSNPRKRKIFLLLTKQK